MRSRWILRFLNTRFFRFPDGLTIRAREGWELVGDSKHNFLRVVEGQEQWLRRSCDSQGVVNLGDANAHWWILKEDVDKDSGHNAPGGHVAALFQDELYEMVTGRAGIARLQAFGAIFGSDRIVVYVEPTSPLVTSNTSRTNLLIEGENLDWARWAAEFRTNLPDEIVLLQEQIGSRSSEKDHRKAISERLKQINELLRFSRFRPSPKGTATVRDDAETNLGGRPASANQNRNGASPAGQKGGRSGDIYSLFAEGGNLTASPVGADDQPRVSWVTAADGTRTPPDLDDRAAKYIPDQNLIMINADFRVFTDMVDRWQISYAHIAGSEVSIREVVHEWFEQQLVEAVMSALSLRKVGKWSFQEIETLWSEHALTAAVLPRWHVDQSIKRHLGQRLGTLKAA
jgi:general stress protein YciG